ncbi:SusC/RagA family TonB-linked outer membrane protein [Danxiaibacter flavus]|uniref:SusC/RagA family TonB-linked outer membrane protein n=1 Tax=Danxiaibacter flavus TaxID=3049108 RepID=A0ABV3ZFM9_9BACT|nr:SusC/RagA family TonB-linked outer membrane protein [Chitinophagaceae bacterium DXS]
MYGARGSNGVILITTKRGNSAKGTIITYDASLSIGKMANKISVLNSRQFLDVLKQGMANNPLWGAGPRTLDLSDTRLFKTDGTPIYNTDWQDEVTRTAVSNNHQISIQQRGENSSTGVFLNYSYNQGIMLNSDLRRLNARLAHDNKINNWLDFGANLMINNTVENVVYPSTGGNNPTRTMIEMPSIFPVKLPDGEWANNMMSSTFSFLDPAENPVKFLEEQVNRNTRTQLFGNLFFNFKLAKDLEFKTQLGVDMQSMLYDSYSPSTIMNWSADQKGVASVQSERYNYWQWENFLTYRKKYKKHSINAMAGASWQQRIDRTLNGSTQYFSDDYFQMYNLGAGGKPNAPGSGYDQWSINSFFARIGYTFADRFLLTLTGRDDGSSRFGSSNKYAFFPSAGAGYIVSKEKFMEKIPAINYLKVRASYGLTGNTEIGSYQSIATINSQTSLINGSRVGSSYVRNLANPDLRWEKTAQTDVGFELQLFRTRISLEADYYYKLTTDLLLNKPIPNSTGFDGVLSNIGSMSNQGLDIALNTMNIQQKNSYWKMGIVANYNKNRIEKLGNNNEDIFPGPYWGPVSDGFTILRVGEAAGSFWGYQRLGTYSIEEVAEGKAKDPNYPYHAGEEKESANKTILGKGAPTWTGSFVNTFGYKNFDLLIDLQFSQGASLAQAFLFSSEDRTGYSNSLSTVLNGWTPANQNTNIQQLRFAPDAGQTACFDSHWVSNGSFIRGRNVAISYNFSTHFTELLKIKRAKLYISAQNLFLIKSGDYKGYDPQSISWSTAGAPPFGQNIEFYQYPKARTFTAGLNVSL